MSRGCRFGARQRQHPGDLGARPAFWCVLATTPRRARARRCDRGVSHKATRGRGGRGTPARDLALTSTRPPARGARSGGRHGRRRARRRASSRRTRGAGASSSPDPEAMAHRPEDEGAPMDGHEMTSSPAHRAGAAAGSGDPGSSGYGGWDAARGRRPATPISQHPCSSGRARGWRRRRSGGTDAGARASPLTRPPRPPAASSRTSPARRLRRRVRERRRRRRRVGRVAHDRRRAPHGGSHRSATARRVATGCSAASGSASASPRTRTSPTSSPVQRARDRPSG